MKAGQAQLLVKMFNKKEIRRTLRIARGKETRRKEKSSLVMERLFSLPEWPEAKTVLYYFEFSSEVITSISLDKAWSEGKVVCFPRVCGNDLRILEIKFLTELLPGAYGIMEPGRTVELSAERQIASSDIDLILVPGLAFDEQGYRLGSGYAFYDRFLKTTRPDSLRVGLAFESQVLPLLPREEHDERIDILLTETRMRRFERLPS